jgi:hypothetical protein
MSNRSKLVATAAVLGVLATALATVVHSAFTSTARNDGNTFQAGSISLTDDDQAKVLWDVSGLRPSSELDPKCVTVSYGSSGGLASAVRLYGETSGALAEHLRLKVTRGSFGGEAPAAGACTGFGADATDFAGKGAGVLYDGTLAGYPQRWDDGVADPRAAWSAGDRATYRLEVSLTDTDDAQGKSASHAFAFEARS